MCYLYFLKTVLDHCIIYEIGLYTVLANLSINTIWLCNFNANFCNSLVFRLFFWLCGCTNNMQMRTLIGLVFGFGSILSGLFGPITISISMCKIIYSILMKYVLFCLPKRKRQFERTKNQIPFFYLSLFSSQCHGIFVFYDIQLSA